MPRILTLLILFGVLLPLLSAQASQSTWSWNTYTGVSHWHVVATEDDTDCQAGINTESYDITIQNKGQTATMGDVGHGPAEGTFISPNILHIPGRTVNDPPGSSTLSDYDVLFTTDCSAFAARYTWEYTDQAGSCSGSTSLSGTNSAGCPAPSIEQQIEDADNNMMTYLDLRGYIEGLYYLNRYSTADKSAQMKQVQEQMDELETTIIAQYKAVLDKDPNNLQAKIGMQTLWANKASNPYLNELDPSSRDRCRQNQYQYLDEAARSMTKEQIDAMHGIVAAELHFSTMQAPENSGVMNELNNEEDNWQGPIEGQDFQKEYSDKSTRAVKLFATLGSPTDVINSVKAK
jgi:hypothetical protein